MDDPGLLPPVTRPDPASGPPVPYRDVGLIPPAGPARTWGLTVIGAPLLLVLLVGLIGGLTHDDPGSGSGSTGAAGPYSGFGTQTSAWPQASPTTAYASASATASTALPGDVFSTWPGSATATTTSSATATAEPQAVVAAYFDAINNRDYQTAWDLGGKNLNADYASFASGFATTQRDTISDVSVQGAVVRLTLNALSTDGTSRSYDAAYTVIDGEITSGTATPTT
ncbi:hypothetical protein [Streptomyces sp. NBC_01262]|uniref:hypothetical protein n=1 Tax=Streptomyces sp. NBC_01262 TaxID=2903803 RepID=UPI002E32E678|nr:hypothetical protein [Streptomyces sp. NBC_01262]